MKMTMELLVNHYKTNYKPDSDDYAVHRENSAWEDADSKRYIPVDASSLPAELSEYREHYKKQGLVNLSDFIGFLCSHPYDDEDMIRDSKVSSYNYPLF